MNATFTKTFLLAATVGAGLALASPASAFIAMNGDGGNGITRNGDGDNGLYVNRGGQSGTATRPLDISTLQIQSVVLPAPSAAPAERK